jgi:hypothetical protein
MRARAWQWNRRAPLTLSARAKRDACGADLEPKESERKEETAMGLGRGLLLWLLGVPLPIVILLALFWHH